MLTRIRQSIRRDEGASAVEYGLLVAGIAAVIVFVVFALGTQVNSAFTTVNDCIANDGTGASCSSN